MTTAAQFMAQLKEDNVLGAIETIKRALAEKARAVIVQSQAEIAETYKMTRIAEADDEDEQDEDDEDEDEEKDDDEEQLDKNKKTSKDISDEDEKEQ